MFGIFKRERFYFAVFGQKTVQKVEQLGLTGLFGKYFLEPEIGKRVYVFSFHILRVTGPV
jgi:hypothetical protein